MAGYKQTSKSLLCVSAKKCKNQHKQNIATCDNSIMLILFLLFYAQAVVLSVGTSLAFMIKGLSCHASCKICCHPSEFYNYYLL